MLRDLSDNETLLSEALPEPIPKVRFDFTPPVLLIPARFGQLVGPNDDFETFVTVSPDTQTLAVSAYPCTGSCHHLMPPEAWQVDVASAQALSASSVTQVEGAPGKWRIALNTQAIAALGRGRFALSAVATDAAGLSSTECALSTAEDDTCWLGVVVIDQSAPSLESAELTLAPLRGR